MVFYGRHFRNLLNMRKKFKIANKIIGDGHPTFLIAEIASNHNRSRATTKKLIEAAADSGFELLVSNFGWGSFFQKRNDNRRWFRSFVWC